MAYTPQLADIQDIDAQQAAYQPTLADIPAQPQPSLMQEVGRGLGEFGVGGLRGVERTLGALTGGHGAEALHALAPAATQVMGIAAPHVDPTSLPYRAGQLAGIGVGAGPATAAFETGLPGVISGIPRLMATGGLTGAAITPGGVPNRLLGAGLGTALGGMGGLAAAGIGRGIQGGRLLWRYLMSKDPNELSQALHDSKTIGGPQGIERDTNQMNEVVNNRARTNALNTKQTIGDGFNSWLGRAATRGYDPQIHIGVPGISFAPTSKFIKLTPNTTNAFSKLLTIAKQDNSPLSEDLANGLNRFYAQGNRSLQGAHDLQSQMLEDARNIQQADEKTKVQTNALNALYGGQHSLMDDVGNTLSGYGDQDLANEFTQLKNAWRNKYIPYTKAPETARLLGGKSDPNILNVLQKTGGAKPGEVSPYQLMRDDIVKNPDQVNDLAGLVLSKGASFNKDTGLMDAPAASVLRSYAKTPNRIKAMINPSIGNQLNAVRENYAINRAAQPLLKSKTMRALKYGIPIGLGVEAGRRAWEML